MRRHVSTINQAIQNEGLKTTLSKAQTFLCHHPKLFPFHRNIRRKIVNAKYVSEMPIHPYQKMYVDPNCIKTISQRPYDFGDIGKVISGNWDQTDNLFEEYDLHNAFVNHFEHELSWEDTEFYHRVIESINQGKSKWACSTPQQFRERLSKIDDLYESIKSNGYHESGKIPGKDPMDSADRKNYLHPYLDEIKVDIGRDGDYLFLDGRHRLSICKILDVDLIPILVIARHDMWQQTRERVYDEYTDSSLTDIQKEEYLDHPDIANYI